MYKVLVVDDIAANRKLLRQMLVMLKDYECVEAVDGQDAVRQFEQHAPDLVLMDINMPKMNGYQSATAIKAKTGENYVPIIFVTALNSEVSLSNALASGGDDFISKPFNVEMLESKINAHLRIRDLNLQLANKNRQLMAVNKHLVHDQALTEHFFETALQKSFLDDRIIQYHMSSMSAFNGDIFLAKRGPNGGMYMIMGDFTGHGLTAAMGTLPVSMIFFTMVDKGVDISGIARELNRQLVKLLPLSMFFCATLVELGAKGDILSVWMGGMPDNFWFGKDGELKGKICSRHMPLGILDDNEFDASTSVYNVEVGDKLYFYSDGVVESENAAGEMFGEEKLLTVLSENREHRFFSVLNALSEFTDGSRQNDDITFVEMTCSEIPPGEKAQLTPDTGYLAIPWNLSVSLSVDEIRGEDPVANVVDILGAMPGLAHHKGILHMVLSEMFSNSLEHSILGLDSAIKEDEDAFAEYYALRQQQLDALDAAHIDFAFTLINNPQTPGLKISITDSGKGYQGGSHDASGDELHGRGMALIKSFCDNVAFSSNGCRLEAVFRL